jgi:hypothetical protein
MLYALMDYCCIDSGSWICSLPWFRGDGIALGQPSQRSAGEAAPWTRGLVSMTMHWLFSLSGIIPELSDLFVFIWFTIISFSSTISLACGWDRVFKSFFSNCFLSA